jgi:hypothetical protein
MKHDIEINKNDTDKKIKIEKKLSHLLFGEINNETLFKLVLPKESLYAIMDDEEKVELKDLSFGGDKLIPVLNVLGIVHQEKETLKENLDQEIMQ